MPGQVDFELVFDKLTSAEKHFFSFCCHFMGAVKKLPKNFWKNKIKNITEIDEEHLRIFSAFLTDIVLDYLKENNALMTSSATSVNGKLERNQIIFELNEDNNRNISYEIIDKLKEIWSISLRLNSPEIYAHRLRHLDVSGFNNSDWLYDFVLNHIIFQKLLLESDGKYLVVLDDSRKLIQKIIEDSPFSMYCLPDLRLLNLLDIQNPKLSQSIVREVLKNKIRLPFFYEYITKSWIKFEFNTRFAKDSDEFTKFHSLFTNILNNYVSAALSINEATHLLELPLKFYSEFFEITEQTDWLNVRREFMLKIVRKSDQSRFIQVQQSFFKPLELIVDHLINLRNTSMIEHTEFDSYLRSLPFANIEKLSQNVEIYRHKLNKLLT